MLATGLSWYRIKAILIRSLYAERRNITRISETSTGPSLTLSYGGLLEHGYNHLPHRVSF